MLEVLQHAIALVNLPFTVLVALVLIYWVFSLLGALDLDFLSFDFDAETELDVDGAHASHGLLFGVGRFLHLDAVPFMIALSFIAVFGWMASLILNGFLNPGFNAWIGLGLLPVSLIVSALATRLTLTPFRGVFSRIRQTEEKGPPILGQVGHVITSEVTDKFGMAELDQDGVHLKLQIRVQTGETLTRGDQVLFVKRDDDSGAFYVRKADSPQTLP